LISGLRPPIIDEFGIVAAIEYLVSEQPAKGPQIEFDHEVRFNRLPDLLEGTVFRIVQEALNNVQRHSRAKYASVRMWHADNELYLEIRDDGVGFEIDKVTEHHFGLRGMRERSRLLKGRADIRSTPGEGTLIHVELPIAALMSVNEDRQHWRSSQRKPAAE
jgi:signal transduction histidine kinase